MNQTTQSLLTTADLLTRQGGLDPTFHARAVFESWSHARAWHFSRLALLSGVRGIDMAGQKRFLEALERRVGGALS